MITRHLAPEHGGKGYGFTSTRMENKGAGVARPRHEESGQSTTTRERRQGGFPYSEPP